ncbi:hypothetical protein EVAR_86446_1 [Eumeta japonica]|uniref:Uncharacterized protein n=1 Tax=Eumeta variegata TaxID=151549 RepID=A0A4C1SG65_EUMVA|nr:hypothetical protein EVAR_86446_1 [Eumeta japonica]
MAFGRWRKMETPVLLIKRGAVSSAKSASWTPDVRRGMSLVYAGTGGREADYANSMLINRLVARDQPEMDIDPSSAPTSRANDAKPSPRGPTDSDYEYRLG